MAGERTEAPTPRKIHEARKKGNVSQSQELVSIGALLLAVVAFRALGPRLWTDLGEIMREGLSRPIEGEMTAATTAAMGRDSAWRMLTVLAPLLALLMFAGTAISMAQTGLLVTTARLQPKLSHISPGTGLKRLISVDGLVNLLKALAKMGIVAVVVYLTMVDQLREIISLSEMSVGAATASLARLSYDIALRAALVLFVLAVADFAWQRRRYIQNLKMSKEELKQEMRETEGDPQIKAAIRRHRQSLLNRMIAAVPKADVVVTNPTHYAVALKYDPVTMNAPVVVAKGERLLAQRIKDVAKKAGVPVLEEPPLARALYAAVPIGHPIPANLFHAVAEVLAWVYALRARVPFGRPAAAAGQV